MIHPTRPSSKGKDIVGLFNMEIGSDEAGDGVCLFIDSSDCHPLLMTAIVSPGGLCSPLLWMSRFVLPPGGPLPLPSHLPFLRLSMSFEWDHFTCFDHKFRWNWNFGFCTLVAPWQEFSHSWGQISPWDCIPWV